MNTLTSLYTPHVLNVMHANIVVLSLSIMNVQPQCNMIVHHYQLQVVVMVTTSKKGCVQNFVEEFLLFCDFVIVFVCSWIEH